MIIIKVTAQDGAPVSGDFVAEFDEMGGNIGRTPGSILMLPDPGRHISRTHASITFRAGRYFIRDLGTASPVILNGKALGSGNEAPIGDGDELRIAAYTMRVVAGPLQKHAHERAGPADAAATGGPKQDPLLAFGADPGAAGPFADLIAPSPAPARMAPNTPVRKSEEAPPKSAMRPAAARSEGPTHRSPAIPEDFDLDPFAEPPPQAPPPAVLPDDLDLGLGPSAGPRKLDELFDLSSVGTHDPFKPGNPLAPPIDDWSSSPVVDPLVAIGAAPAAKRAAQAAQRNDTPEIHGAFVLPKLKGKADVPPADANGPSQTDEDVGARPAPEPKMRVEDPEPVRAPPEKDTARPQAAAAPAPPSEARGNYASDDMLRAFLSGAGLPDAQIPGALLTPQMMSSAGELFRECIQGTLDLLRARAMTKREIRAKITILVAQENNPLKFSPTVEAALLHLLAPGARGFMTPRQAIKDAYDDLRSHDLGFMAGMRAALAGVLQRFRPEQLEKRLTANSVMDALVPTNRKARLWDLFVELSADISKEVEDDFQTVFGREFLRAYEAQIAEIEREENGKQN